MTTPLPWSHTSLDDFVNCPRAFYEKRVAKSVKEEETEQLIWGNKVHKAFELRIKDGTPLPDILAQHENFLAGLANGQGENFTERKIALNRKGQPCGFFDKDVWFRGVIDYHNIFFSVADVVDYKTGKPHTKFKQLELFALWIFAQYPDVHAVRVGYYWTGDQKYTSQMLRRDQIKDIWAKFLPDLRQYAQAFKEDIWQPRQSGLCNGWCPVTGCEFWKPKRSR